MWLIKKGMSGFRTFTFVDAMIFELYLFTVAIVLAQLLPIVLTLNIWIYAIIPVIGFAIILPSIFKKTKEGKGFMKNYRKLSMWKIGIYKIAVMSAGLLVLKLIPAMLLLDIAWYVGIACFGLGYLMAIVFRRK